MNEIEQMRNIIDHVFAQPEKDWKVVFNQNPYSTGLSLRHPMR